MTDKCFDKSNVFKKENDSFKEMKKLDELLVDNIDEGACCTTPEVNRIVPYQSKAIANDLS